MHNSSDALVDEARRFMFLREETRFEIGLLHDRINALISAESFLTIAFTIAMTSSNGQWGAAFTRAVPPVLSVVGLVLAVFAWPGIDASFRIINEWTARQRQFMQANPTVVDLLWRLDVPSRGSAREDPNTRRTMFFARAVPVVFGLAWAILSLIAVLLPLRH